MYYYIFSITRVCFLGVCWGRFVVLEGLEAQKRAKEAEILTQVLPDFHKGDKLLPLDCNAKQIVPVCRLSVLGQQRDVEKGCNRLERRLLAITC